MKYNPNPNNNEQTARSSADCSDIDIPYKNKQAAKAMHIPAKSEFTANFQKSTFFILHLSCNSFYRRAATIFCEILYSLKKSDYQM